MPEIYIQTITLLEEDDDIVLDYDVNDIDYEGEQYELYQYVSNYLSNVHQQIIKNVL
jgi:hypothetical protein